jgi:hypothetical protein
LGSEPLQRLQDYAVNFFTRELTAHDAVVIVDGDVPDNPPDLHGV